MSKRLDELDSLRGLAATSVMFAHLSIILPAGNWFEKLNSTPFHIFWLGHESVILFFILSGFVLSLPFYSNKQSSYKTFAIKRVCRILLPSSISVIVGLLLMSQFYSGTVNNLSDWFNQIWSERMSVKQIIEHIVLLNDTDTMRLNPVLWSLIQEMRISLLFPLIMYFILRSTWKINIGIMLAIPIVFFVVYYTVLKLFQFDVSAYTWYSSFSITPHYIAFFILGALLAKYKNQVSVVYHKMSLFAKILIFAFSCGAYLYAWIVAPNSSLLHLFIINDWAIAVGASIFIVIALNSVKVKNVLLLKPVHLIGQASYSLYLYHMLVILTMLHLFDGKLDISWILGLSVITSFVISIMMYYLVEIPSIKLGKRLTTKVKLIENKAA